MMMEEKSKEFEIFKDFDALRITLVSPEIIQKSVKEGGWSWGEVTRAETINYRTQKPERDGLFCEKIFGPVRDYECNCGKYKKIRYKGIVCDRCGVEVTLSKVRRERMGHIKLVVPVAHILFYQVPPSKIGLLLDLTINELESILNYETYIILDPGSSPYNRGELLSEEDYLAIKNKYEKFVADTGAPALKYLLAKLDLEDLAAELKVKIKRETSERFSLLRRLKVVEAFRASGVKPEWMILEAIPVIPPDLRPLVPLEGGRFATSDLNDLYKRVIVRNNRLKHLLSIKTPDIILKNEKRMLQDAVDALFSNETRPKPARGVGNRILKSLCETLRGKQGRFRRNLLGKRVDYSGRSVIVVDPTLRLHQCALPKEIAYELFKPFIMQKFEEKKLTEGETAAKLLHKKCPPEVWEILEEITKSHPVLLNRAPTLHRLSIEAFFPVLVEHRAIGIHPCVCPPFNADFDGDTMAVHLPLIPEAILESISLILAPFNILSPAHGKPLMVPTQDIVAGIYYLTKVNPSAKKINRVYDDFREIHSAYQLREMSLHDMIKFRYKGTTYETTVGRVIFNEILPDSLRFANDEFTKEKLVALLDYCHRKLGSNQTANLLDAIKDLGFEIATMAGLSIGLDDIVVPKEKPKILKESEDELRRHYTNYQRGLISESEKYNFVVTTWTQAAAKVEEALMKALEKDQDGFNPLFLLLDSGARGSKSQAVQIGGMRGLMSKPQRRMVSEEIIETPIKSSFKEGLSVWEYFISTHGARKGLTDTALKTAEAGYLTRRLVDVAQDVVITMDDCGTILGQEVSALREGGDIIEPLAERIVGRIPVEDIINPITGEVIVKADEEITEELAEEIENSGIEKVKVRSVLTCEAPNGLCVKCYGRNPATGKLVEVGEAVGIIAAQSIGEPGTQLTLKTFHLGGATTGISEENKALAKFDGEVHLENLPVARRSDNEMVAMAQGRLLISSDHRVIPYNVPEGAILKVTDKEKVKEGDILFEWEPYSVLIIAKRSGRVRYVDIEPDITLREDVDERTDRRVKIITEDREKKRHPQIEIVGDHNNILERLHLPSGAYLIVEDGQRVLAGDTIARFLKEVAKIKDITGGLPKVAELFEAKRVKDPAVISEIDGTVEVEEPHLGMRTIKVISDEGSEKVYRIPYGKYLLVRRGDKVKAGDKLCEGEVDPHDVLKVKGWLVVQEFLTNQILAVYRIQNVKIDDKHISIIVRQMLRKVKIEDPGDSNFLEGEIVERKRVLDENRQLIKEARRPISHRPILLGITRAALLTESFLSAASFQETTRILSDAAISQRVDYLHGLKENVIVGRLIPAGTGFREFLTKEAKEREEDERKREAG